MEKVATKLHITVFAIRKESTIICRVRDNDLLTRLNKEICRRDAALRHAVTTSSPYILELHIIIYTYKFD